MPFEWGFRMSRDTHSSTRTLAHTRTQSHGSGETSRSNLSTAASNEPFGRAREFQNETDPMRRMWAALESAGCKPAGQTNSFRSCCPAHDGSNPQALVVNEGSDGRVLFRCWTGCEPKAVLSALGLPWAAMFPPGHRSAAPMKPRPVKALSGGAKFLDSLMVAGFPWVAHVVVPECPYCGAMGAYLSVHDRGGVDVMCPDGCTRVDVMRAVETRASIAERGVQL